MHKTYFKQKKHVSSQKIRSTWINLCLCLWGMIIVRRDKVCQWCGGTNSLTGHHIVTRGSTMGYKLCWFDLDNGVTLCLACHGTAHGRGRKKTFHEYIDWEKVYLEMKNTSYDEMKIKYSVIHKMSTSDVILQFNVLQRLCEEMKIQYAENSKYKKLINVLTKA